MFPRFRHFAVIPFLLIGAGLAVPAAAQQEPKFIPQGHTYAPDTERLPQLNSSRDNVNNQTDIFETEIYHKERERAIFQGELDRMIQHDFDDGVAFEPRY